MGKTLKYLAILLSFVGAIFVILFLVKHSPRNDNQFESKRLTENQIIAYRDSNVVEYYFDNQSGTEPAEIIIEVQLDGYYNVAKETIPAGETGMTGTTINGEPYSYFVAGIYPGRILLFDYKSGKLKARIDNLEFRLYNSVNNPYDALVPQAASEREMKLDEEEQRPSGYQMRADIKQEELIANIPGLFSEWRPLDSHIYAIIDGNEVLIARAEGIAPRSLLIELDLEEGAADVLKEGQTYDIRVDSVYSDTQEFYDSISGSVEVYRAD